MNGQGTSQAGPPSSGTDVAFRRILELAQQDLRLQLTAEVQERETRLLALLNAIGHSSLDSLEDFIFLHGAAVLIPASAQDGINMEETQTQFVQSETAISDREQRHRQRKTQLAETREELTRVKAELDYANSRLSVERHAKDEAVRDLQRLLDPAVSKPPAHDQQQEDVQMAVDQPKAATTAAAHQLRQQLDAARQVIDQALADQDRLHAACDSAGEAMRSAEARETEERSKRIAVEKELAALKQLGRTPAVGDRTVATEEAATQTPVIIPPPLPAAATSNGLSLPNETVYVPQVGPASVTSQGAPPSTSAPAQASGPEAPPMSVAASDPPAPPPPSSMISSQTATAQINLYTRLHDSYYENKRKIEGRQIWLADNEAATRREAEFRGAKLPSRPPTLESSDMPDFPAFGDVRSHQLHDLYTEMEQKDNQLRSVANLQREYKQALMKLKLATGTATSKETTTVKRRRKSTRPSPSQARTPVPTRLGASSLATPHTPNVPDVTARASRASASPGKAPVSPRRRSKSPQKRSPVKSAAIRRAFQRHIASSLQTPVSVERSADATGNPAETPLASQPQKGIEDTSSAAQPQQRQHNVTPNAARQADVVAASAVAHDSPHDAERLALSPSKRSKPVDLFSLSASADRTRTLSARAKRIKIEPLVYPSRLQPMSPRPPRPSRQDTLTTTLRKQSRGSTPTRSTTVNSENAENIAPLSAPPSSWHTEPDTQSEGDPAPPVGDGPAAVGSPAPASSQRLGHSPPLAVLSPNKQQTRQSFVKRESMSPRFGAVSPSPVKPIAANLAGADMLDGQDAVKQEDAVSDDSVEPPSGLRVFANPGSLPLSRANLQSPHSDGRASRKRTRKHNNDDVDEVKPRKQPGSARAKLAADDADADIKPSLSKAKGLKRRFSQTSLAQPSPSRSRHDSFDDVDGPAGGQAAGPSDILEHRRQWIEQSRAIKEQRKAESRRIEAEKAAKKAQQRPTLEINPARNNGKMHHYTEVVRNKEARKNMYAMACEQCEAYYKLAGEAPGKCTHTTENHFLSNRAQNNQAQLQALSRHRATHRPDPDPPEYWQMGFPSTQAVESIAQQAEAQRQDLRMYQEAEAAQGGFYRFKRS